MTGEDLNNLITNLQDGEELDETLSLALQNHVKDLVEDENDWVFTRKENILQTFSPSETFETAKDLPTDFYLPRKLFVGNQEYKMIDLALRRNYENTGNKFAIDWANKKFYLCGSVAELQSIYNHYNYETPGITMDVGPVWPEKFQKLIAFLVVAINLSGIDVGDITLKQALALSKEGSAVYAAMVAYNNKIKLMEQGNAAGIRGTVRNSDGLIS